MKQYTNPSTKSQVKATKKINGAVVKPWGAVPIDLCTAPGVTKNALRVYIALSSFQGRDLSCWPSREKIMGRSGCNKSAASEALTWLADRGWVIRERRGRKLTNVYHVVMPVEDTSDVRETMTSPEESDSRETRQSPEKIESDSRETRHSMDSRETRHSILKDQCEKTIEDGVHTPSREEETDTSHLRDWLSDLPGRRQGGDDVTSCNIDMGGRGPGQRGISVGLVHDHRQTGHVQMAGACEPDRCRNLGSDHDHQGCDVHGVEVPPRPSPHARDHPATDG